MLASYVQVHFLAVALWEVRLDVSTKLIISLDMK